MRTEAKIEFNMDRNLETLIPKRISAPVSCHPLEQRSDCIHLPHIMFTSSISINTYQLSLYCDPRPEFPPWKTRHWPELTWAVLLRQPHTLSHDTIQGTESVPPLQLAAQSQTSAKADLPAVHTGPMEGPVHLTESGDSQKEKLLAAPSPLLRGQSHPCSAGRSQGREPGWGTGNASPVTHFLSLPQQTWLCLFCVHFVSLLLIVQEWDLQGLWHTQP